MTVDAAEPASAPPAPSLAARVRLLAGLAVTGLLLWAILARIDLAKAWAAAAALSPATLASAVGLIATSYAAKVARWHLMLVSVASPALSTSASTLLAGVALNNVLPLRAGDVARAFAFRAQIGAPASAILPLLVMERLLDMAMLVAIAGAIAVPMAQAGVVPALLAPAAWLGLIVVAAIAALLLAAGPLARAVERDEERALSLLPASVRSFAGQAIHVTARQLRGRQALALIGLSALAWIAESGMLAVLATGMGFDRPILAGYLAAAAATLATLVPSAPGFFGTFHAAAIAAVSLFGAPADPAAAFAFTAHMLLWLPLTATGLVALARLSATRTPTPSTPPLPTGPT